MQVNRNFKSEVKSRVINEWIGIVHWFITVLGTYRLLSVKILNTPISLLFKISILCFHMVCLGVLLFFSFKRLQRLQRIIIEKNESEDIIDVILYSGKTLRLFKKEIKVAEYNWKIRTQNYTKGRMFKQESKSYFSPDSEFALNCPSSF